MDSGMPRRSRMLLVFGVLLTWSIGFQFDRGRIAFSRPWCPSLPMGHSPGCSDSTHWHVSFSPTRSPYPKNNITRVCVIGERTSGTNWLTETLALNFPNTTIHPNCFVWKHWFHSIADVQKEMEEGDLIVIIFRNAIDWTLHFWKQPWHSGNHLNISYEEFLLKPWVNGENTEIYGGINNYETYQEKFGGPFPRGDIRDVLQLRNMKVDNFLRLQSSTLVDKSRVILTRYEDLIASAGKGMEDLINELKWKFSTPGFLGDGKSDVLVSKAYKWDTNILVDLHEFEKKQVYYSRDLSGTPLTKETIGILLAGLDLNLERIIGYKYDHFYNLTNNADDQ